jgi:hypothetical protein
MFAAGVPEEEETATGVPTGAFIGVLTSGEEAAESWCLIKGRETGSVSIFLNSFLIVPSVFLYFPYFLNHRHHEKINSHSHNTAQCKYEKERIHSQKIKAHRRKNSSKSCPYENANTIEDIIISYANGKFLS